MRGVFGLVLAGVGTFLIVCAVVLPTWISGQVIKFPLNEYETATLDASNASYFSTTTLTEKTGVSMQATYTIKGDGAAGDSSTAVWNEYSYVYDLTNRQPVQQQTRTLAFNRRTGQLVNCCGASLNGNTSIRQTGLAGYVWPIGTKKQTYQVFDATLNKPMPFVYSGTTTVHGITTYKFEENVAPVQVTTLSVPGSLVGESAATVTLPEFYEMHLIYYVDPTTGALVNVNEHQTMSLRSPATGAQALLLFDADLIATPATVNTVVGLDTTGRNELSLLKTILPLVLGILGVIALIAGIFLSRRRHDDIDAGLHGTSPESAAEAADAPEPAASAPAAEPEVVPGMKDEAPAEAPEPPEEAPAEVSAQAPAESSEEAPGEAPAEVKAEAPEAAESEAEAPEPAKTEAAKAEAE